MKQLKELSAAYRGENLGYEIMMAIIKEMLSQEKEKNWTLSISDTTDNEKMCDYQLRVAWGDEDYHKSYPFAHTSDKVLIMNYYKLQPCEEKDSIKMSLIENTLEVCLLLDRCNMSDKTFDSTIIDHFRNIEKTVMAVIDGSAKYVYGNSNLNQ